MEHRGNEVNRFEQFLLNTAEEPLACVKRVGSPNLKTLLGIYHTNNERTASISCSEGDGIHGLGGDGAFPHVRRRDRERQGQPRIDAGVRSRRRGSPTRARLQGASSRNANRTGNQFTFLSCLL